MSAAADPSRIDALWEELAPHVEWPEGFSLVFLFAGHPRPVGELRSKLEESVRHRGKTLRVLDPEDAKAVEELTRQVIVAPGAECGALWISLLRQAGTREWTVAVREVLQRLNERRFLLERDVKVPVVIVLPLELRADVYVFAPDLWTVRSFAEQVPGPLPDVTQELTVSRTTTKPSWSAAEHPSPVEVLWSRLLSRGDQGGLAATDGLRALDAALERGDLRAAREIAKEALSVVMTSPRGPFRKLSDDEIEGALDKTHLLGKARKRELATVLDAMGEVETLAGNIAAARKLFERGLRLREETEPEYSRRVATSLENLGRLEAQSGNLTAARDLFRRALRISEARADPSRIMSAFGRVLHGLWPEPDVAQAQRDLSVSLDDLGRVELQAGNLEAARDLFQRAIAVSARLTEADPQDSHAQRDLAVSLENLGKVEMRAGNIGAARTFLRRALSIFERLAMGRSESIPAQRDLSVALNQLGVVEKQAGNLEIARELFERALHLREILAKSSPRSPQAQRDVSVSLNQLGKLEVQAGNYASAYEILARDLSIAEALAKGDPSDAHAGFDVVISLFHLADVCRRQQDRATELAHLQRAATILETMAAKGQLAGFPDRERLREEVTRRLLPPAEPEGD